MGLQGNGGLADSSCSHFAPDERLQGAWTFPLVVAQ